MTVTLNKVFYVGALAFPTGYGEAARLHVKALANVGVTVSAALNGPIPASPEHSILYNELIRDDQINEMMDTAITPREGAQAAVWHSTADSLGRIAGIPNFAYSVWEVEGLPRGWAQSINERSDGLLTPSAFSARLFREGGVTKPIAVSPHPIDLERFNPQADPKLREAIPAKTLFLVVSQWMFRKGVEDALIAYLSEFRRDEGTGLLLVLWGKSHAFPEQMRVKEQIKAVRDSLNLPDTPRVWTITHKLHPLALPSVYAASDALVCASRGEAFGLPIFEAAACGKPTIATGYGGMWDFLTDETAYRLPYRLETLFGAGPIWRHYNATQKWARPTIDDLRKAMRQVHEDHEGARRKGALAAEMVMSELSFPIAGRRMKEGIERLMDEAKA